MSISLKLVSKQILKALTIQQHQLVFQGQMNNVSLWYKRHGNADSPRVSGGVTYLQTQDKLTVPSSVTWDHEQCY